MRSKCTALVGSNGAPYAVPMPRDNLASGRLRFLALLHSPPASGSDTTIRRIISHLRALGHSVILQPDPADPAELARLAGKHDADALIGTHAFLSGRSFYRSGLPYVLILGGTDVNELAGDPDCLETMTRALKGAASVVVFNEDFRNRCLTTWPDVEDKIRHIPQGVRTFPSEFSLRKYLALPADSLIFLLPSGLRPVKDPLFLAGQFSRWHRKDPRITLVIAGLAYEPGYQELALRRIGAADGLHYAGALAQPDLHAAMREATAVLNTSLSECSPNAVLEAMNLRRPVMVRDIPGNTCLVEHERTGLVFSSPAEFEALARRLTGDPAYGFWLAARGREFVERRHGLASECAGYAEVIAQMAGAALGQGGEATSAGSPV